MDLMDTVSTRNRSWTLPQSNTGLCNITKHNKSNTQYWQDNVLKKRHKKHKTKPYKRRSTKQPQITNKTVDIDTNVAIPRRERSRSRPRLSQAILFQLDDEEIHAKKKKKEEFLVHRVKQKNDETMPKHVKRERKHNKKLKHIKEKTPMKPSTKKKSTSNNLKNARKRKKKRRRALSSMSAVNKTYTFDAKQNEVNEVETYKNYKKQKRKKDSNIYKSKRKTKKAKENTTNTDTTIVYKRRRKRDHAKRGSHGIDLNQMNQLIKEQTKESRRRKPKLSNHRSYNEKKKNNKNSTSHKRKKKSKKKAKRKSKQKAQKVLNHSRFYRSKRKKRYNINGLLNERKNDRKISNLYEHSISPSPQAPKLDFELLTNPSNSASVYTSDSEIFSPQNTRARSKTDFQKPTVCIQFSPKIKEAEAVFMGYKSMGPTYKFRGRGKEREDYIPQASPSPPAERFTFHNITSKYKPHRIQWSSKTGFTDSELEEDEENQAMYDIDHYRVSTWSESNESEDDEAEPSISIGHNNRHNRAKTEQINRLLAHLLSDEDEEEEIHHGINNEGHDEEGVLCRLSEDDDNDDDDDGNDELLFDIESFVNNLSKKRKLRQNDDEYDND